MSSMPDPDTSSAATGSDTGTTQTEADAVEATTTADAVEPDATETAESKDTAEDKAEEPAAPTAPTPSSAPASEATAEDDEGSDEKSAAGSDEQSDEERQKSAEEFAAEHDPANHDIAAGEEFRQPGDWTADDAGGPQVFDADGNLVSEGDSGSDDSGKDTGSDSGQDSGQDSTDGRRVSELDEVADGGYSVGSAATLHDGAMPVGHPVKAWEDTKTYVTEDHEHYADAEPHVWFTDAEAAERAGFKPAD